MIILANTISQIEAQFSKAAIKARLVRPLVKTIAVGRYEVRNAKGTVYAVFCTRDAFNRKVVSCTCEGGLKGLACYHVAAILPLHVALVSAQKSTIQ